MYQVGTRFRAIRQESLTTVVDSVAAVADTAAVEQPESADIAAGIVVAAPLDSADKADTAAAVDRAGTATAADLSVDTPGTAAAPVAAAGRADTADCMAAGMADTKSLPLPVQVNARPARHPQPSQ